MAKVLPNYSLCPLIERKSFIGITEDSEPDRIVVTVNGNIVSRLIVSNAKLLYSWNTKGTITAPVIYANSVERYIGIFNGNILRLWESNTVNIDKVKSHKFVSELHSVLNVPGGRNRTLVIFKSGHFCDLDEAISARKTIDGGKSSNLPVLQEHESVQKAEVISFGRDKSMISLTTVLADSDELKLHVIPLDDNRVPLTFNLTYSNDDDDVGKYVCHCFVMTDKYSSLITLWSTGKLFITRLFSTFSSNDPDDVASFPGRFLTRLPVNTDNRAVLLRSISAYDIAVYGAANTNNEEHDEKPEGLLLFFNLKYNVLQPLARYKNFTVPPYFFNFGSNLFLIIGHNLVAMPYTLRNQKLSALVGTVSVADDNLHIEEETITTDNNDHQRITISQSSEELKCNNSNNVLIRKLLESNDDVANNNLLHALEACVDISDDVIVDVLKLCLTDIALYGNVLQTLLCRYTLMDSSKLRDVSSNSMLILLDELTTNQFCTTTAFRYQEKVLKWLAAILDVFYTHCLVDETPVIVETLLRMNNFLKGELKRCEDYKQLLALSSVIRRKKIIWNK